MILMLAIVVGGASDYDIVVSKEASPTEQRAAQDLAAHIKEMTGAELAIVTEGVEMPQKASFRASRRWAARNRVHASWYAMPEELGPIQMDRGIAHGMIKYLPAITSGTTRPTSFIMSCRGPTGTSSHRTSGSLSGTTFAASSTRVATRPITASSRR